MEVSDKTRPPNHSPWKIALIIATIIVYVVVLAFNGLAGASAGRDIGLFKNSTGEISDRFSLDVTPAGWTFSIWGFIYAWQALWLVYGLTTICRKIRNGTYIYLLPVMSPVIYLMFIFNNLFNIAWLLAWDRQQIIAALCLIVFTPFTLYIALFVSFKNLYECLAFLRKQEASKEIWLIRFLVQNGMAFYATWTTVASLLNFAMVLVYEADVKNEDACTAILVVLSIEIALWVVLENFVLDKYVRYTFSPYIVLTVALAGSVAKNYDLELRERNSIFSLVLLVIAALLLVVKIIVMVVRHFRKPITPNAEYEPTI